MEQNPPGIVANSTTMLLPQLAAFLAVVEAGSFTAAARLTSSDKTVMSRRVKALEEALGVRLLNRTTRSIHVTAAGRRLVEEACDPVSDALSALVRIRGADHIEGTVRLASTQSLARAVLVPVLRTLRMSHPQLRVELGAQETMTPLVEQGYDLALRVGRMPDSSLIARKLATWRYVLVASPAWIACHSEVRSPADLSPHWMMWGTSSRAQEWRFERGEEAFALRMNQYPLVFDSSQLLIESARAGLGVTAMPPFSVTRELADGSLVRLLETWRVDHEFGIYGVTPHRTMLPSRVQVVLDHLRARLDELAPTWDTLTR